MKGGNDEIFDIAGFLQSKPIYLKGILDKAIKYLMLVGSTYNNHPNNEILTSQIISEALDIFVAADFSHTLNDPLNIEHYGKTNLAGDVAKYHHCDIL
ncbi:hypothetical protein [Rickettsia endosymbiont of Halotydeus destructor]|uniref:hypothetical protein n=1 Tax=Rickettsia endosymbiont of Halotydeus destructor TaxID=2996754 RepID=UPI003BAFB7CB